MFDFVRTHNKLLQLLLLLLILPSFVVFGIQGYSRFNEGGNRNVAKVDGHAITQAEWDAAHQRQVENVRRQAPNIDPKMFDTPAMRAESLEALVRERVVQAAAHDMNLSVSDERLQRKFVADPQFQILRNPDGSLNKEMLAAQGMTSEMFVARLRQDLALQQVLRGVSDSALDSSAAVNAAIDPLLQRREIRLARFDAKDYLDKVRPTDADLEAWHKAHQADYRTPEQATIEYVVLDLEVLKKGLPVPEAELRTYYEQNISRYTSAEERHARHILIKADKDAAADVKQKAKARAEALLAEARKNPAGFAELAKKNSEDEGSAPQGGDLDFFGRGAMVKPFEDAVFAMKPGEISNVVESDFGYHVIKLDAVRGGEKKSFDEVRPTIEDAKRKELAAKKWAESAELFTDTVFSDYQSLQPVVDKLKLDKRNAVVQRTPMPGASGPLASPRLLEAVFDKDALTDKRNTKAIEVGPNQLASARVVQYQPARALPLAEVKDAVLNQVKASQAAALARKEGEARLAQLKANPKDELSAGATLSRAKPENLPRNAVEDILRADATKLPAPLGVTLGEQGYLVVRIDKVLPAELPEAEATALKSQVTQVWARAEAQAYYQTLRARFKTEISPKAADAAASSASP